MGTTVDTQALDLRGQSGLDGGKSRGGQGDGADKFAGLLSDLDGAKPAVQADAATTSSPVANAVAPPDTGLLTLSAGTFAVASAPSLPSSLAPQLPAATPATGPASTDATLSQSVPDTATSIASTTSLFQALIDGTGVKTSTKAKTDPRDDDPVTAPPTANAQSTLTLPALIAAAAVSTPQTIVATPADLKSAPSPKAAPAVTSSMAAAHDDAALSADTAAPISDVKVETHLAVAASHAPAKDQAEPQAAPTEVADPSLPTGALAAMAPQTRSVVQAIETLLDQAPAAAPDPASTATPAPPRTMTLQLSPPDLGTVQVRLHLNGQALDLQLSVSSKETLGAISRDRAHLETALASQNYDLRTLTIQGADGAGAASNGDPQAGGRGASEQGGAQNQGPSTSGNQAGGGNSERRPSNTKGIASDEESRAAVAPRAGALFV